VAAVARERERAERRLAPAPAERELEAAASADPKVRGEAARPAWPGAAAIHPEGRVLPERLAAWRSDSSQARRSPREELGDGGLKRRLQARRGADLGCPGGRQRHVQLSGRCPEPRRHARTSRLGRTGRPRRGRVLEHRGRRGSRPAAYACSGRAHDDCAEDTENQQIRAARRQAGCALARVSEWND